jgi:hypothetical protein
MKNDYTHIAVILDRTGSMEAIREMTPLADSTHF